MSSIKTTSTIGLETRSVPLTLTSQQLFVERLFVTGAVFSGMMNMVSDKFNPYDIRDDLIIRNQFFNSKFNHTTF